MVGITAFWAILHQTHVIITCFAPNAAGNYKLHNYVNAYWNEVKYM